MGDDYKIDGVFYFIDASTGEMKPLGQAIEIPKLAPGGIMDEKLAEITEIAEGIEIEMPITFKRITRKRFIKLLMGKGYQRNHAIKMHEEYIKKYKSRSRIGLEIFISLYN